MKKKGFKIIMAGVVSAIVISLGSVAAYAANTQIGSAGALAASSFTLEEMLKYAIQDEYAARADYSAVITAYGEQIPYTNILRAEERHITRLTQLFETYGYAVPADTATAIAPDSLEASYLTEVTLEEQNIAMYEKFLKETLPADVKTVFEQLKKSSENHKQAFQNASDGNLTGCIGAGNGNGLKGNCNNAGMTNGTCPMNGTGNNGSSSRGMFGRGNGNGGCGGMRGGRTN